MVLPLAVWAALIVVASAVAIPFRFGWKVKAPPFAGEVEAPDLAMVPVVLALGVWLAIRLPRWCARLPWRRLLLVAGLVALAWGCALALVRGPSGLERGLEGRFEYPAVVAQVDRIGVGPFVDTFTDPAVLRRYPIHVQGHPPGAALLFVGLDRVGLDGPAGASLFLVLAGSTTVPAVLLAVREVAGERRARQALPFLVLAPAAIWMVSSADALYTAVGAWAVTLLVLASGRSRSTRHSVSLAIAGGVLFGLGVNLSYGLAPLALVPLTVLVARRAWPVVVGAAAGGVAVVVAAYAGGFWWFDGLAATHARYVAGVASDRPYAYFALLGNPAAVAVALGPAMAVALARVRDGRLWLLAGGALAALVAADLTGLSKAEVERIWLPFVPWLLVLAAGLADGTVRGARRDRPERAPAEMPVQINGKARGKVVVPADADKAAIGGPLPAASAPTAPAPTDRGLPTGPPRPTGPSGPTGPPRPTGPSHPTGPPRPTGPLPRTGPARRSARRRSAVGLSRRSPGSRPAVGRSRRSAGCRPPIDPVPWSAAASFLLVLQVGTAVLVESIVRTVW